MTTCPECGAAGGAHAATCSLARYEAAPVPLPTGAPPPAEDTHGRLLEEIRDELRTLRRMLVLWLVLTVLGMLVAIVASGS